MRVAVPIRYLFGSNATHPTPWKQDQEVIEIYASFVRELSIFTHVHNTPFIHAFCTTVNVVSQLIHHSWLTIMKHKANHTQAAIHATRTIHMLHAPYIPQEPYTCNKHTHFEAKFTFSSSGCAVRCKFALPKSHSEWICAHSGDQRCRPRCGWCCPLYLNSKSQVHTSFWSTIKWTIFNVQHVYFWQSCMEANESKYTVNRVINIVYGNKGNVHLCHLSNDERWLRKYGTRERHGG